MSLDEFEIGGYLSRTMCEVLEEARGIIKHTNHFTLGRSKRVLSSLVEELQVMGNRMEAGLGDKVSIKKLSEQKTQLRKEVKALNVKLKKLEEKVKPKAKK